MNADYLHECFTYEPATGHLYWNVRPASHFKSERGCKAFNSKWAGKRAGSPHPDGYIKVGLTMDGEFKRLLAHRIIWCMAYGDLPMMLDHISGVKDDNRIENLRPATDQQNQANARLRKDNTTGYKGVYRQRGGQFIAQISAKHLGVFGSAEEASEAYLRAAAANYGEFARAA